MTAPTTPIARTSIIKPDQPPTASPAGQAFAMRPCQPARRWSLRLDEADANELGPLAGFTVSQPINTITGDQNLSIRLGPDEWLLIAGEQHTDLQDELERQLEGRFHSLVDVSHRNVAFEVVGEAVEEVLNAGCPLDLDPGSFPPGMATRTILGKVEVVLVRLAEPDRFRLECWRSFARHVEALLKDAARLSGHSKS